MTAPASLDDKMLGHDAAMVAAGQERPYQAASLTDPRMADWVPSPGSADADLLPSLDILRNRSRDLARNSGLAAGYLQTGKDNVIGNQLRLSSTPDYKLLGKDKAWAQEWSALVEAEFRTWANTTECDAASTQTLWGMARTALGSALQNADVVTVPMWLPRPGGRWATRLQNIESDRLSTPPYLAANASVRGGVQIDANGAPVYYYIGKNHPGDRYGLAVTGSPEWVRLPAFTPWGRRAVIHLFDKERPGQSRGAPVFARVLREFKVSSEYVGHELHAAAANALIAGFIESDLDKEAVSEIFGTDQDSATSYWKTVADKYHRKKMESGLFMTLPVGTRLSGYNSGRPNVAFADFIEHIMRHLSAALNIPYELLLKDFSKSNYSSARAALLEAWRFFLSYRQLFVDMWLSPVFALWLEEAVNLGRIEAPDFYAQQYAYCRCRWIFAGRGWVDPTKEAEAAQIRLEVGLSTLETECAEQGGDWEEMLEQQAVEKQRREELGLPDPYATAGRGFSRSTSEVEKAA